jgi:CPA2 family monovalent cation:H+ antiporter-2
VVDAEEVAQEHPVLIFGMTPEGRLAADALRDHDIACIGVDSDPDRFVAAASDGYDMVFGDARDLRIMESLDARRSKAIVLGARGLGAVEAFRLATAEQPCFIAASSTQERAELAALGFRAHIAHAEPRGLELATDLLQRLGIDQERITAWVKDQAERRGLPDSATEPRTVVEAA